MTTTAALCHFSFQTLMDQNGNPIVGGKAYFYESGTTRPKNSYSDAGLSVVNPYPVLTDGYGRFPAMFLDEGDYKVTVKNASDVQMYLVDGLPGGVVSASGGGSSSTTIPTGMIVAAHTDDVFDGWLPLNDKSIGNSSSGATARAADDVEALFILLWNKDSALEVSSGRGASAAADWAASKWIRLPDYRGRCVVGADAMGNTSAGIITSLNSADPDKIGGQYGTEGVALTVATLPVHTPTVTVASGGAHVHTGVTDSVGTHTHSGITDSGGTHNHDLKTVTVAAAAGTAYAVASGGTTGSVGAESGGTHTHSMTTASAGLHSHNLSIDSGGAHTHTATAAAIGSGDQHRNMPPVVVAWWHIKI